jgi:large subunit ribosomal protein L25
MNKKDTQILKVSKRDVFGKKVKRLRKEGLVPSSVYGRKFESISIQANTKELESLFSKLGESGLFNIQIDEGELLPVLFKNPQYHPLTDQLMHIDLYKVDLTRKISAEVPIELIGEAPIVKLGNVLMHITNTIEVEGLPADLPERIEVDVTGLESLENMITVADLEIDKDKLTILTDLEQVVVKAEEPKEEEMEIVETEVEGEEEEGEGEGDGEGEEEGEGKESEKTEEKDEEKAEEKTEEKSK